MGGAVFLESICALFGPGFFCRVTQNYARNYSFRRRRVSLFCFERQGGGGEEEEKEEDKAFLVCLVFSNN